MTVKAKEDVKETKDVAVKEKTALAATGMADMFEMDSGDGFDNMDSESCSIPYLGILQKTSPQCDEDDGAYIEGAKPGMFYNSVSGEVFPEVLLVPVFFERKFIEWVPRDSGGGFVGAYMANDPVVLNAPRGDSGKLMLENGNYLADTRYHYCLMVDPETFGITPVVVSLTSTQIKKSKNWMTVMQNIRLRRKDGSAFTPPSYSHIYKASSIGESNDLGNWKGWKIELMRRLGTDAEKVQFDQTVYAEAKSFHEIVASGQANVADPSDQVNGTPGNTGKEDTKF